MSVFGDELKPNPMNIDKFNLGIFFLFSSMGHPKEISHRISGFITIS